MLKQYHRRCSWGSIVYLKTVYIVLIAPLVILRRKWELWRNIFRIMRVQHAKKEKGVQVYWIFVMTIREYLVYTLGMSVKRCVSSLKSPVAWNADIAKYLIVERITVSKMDYCAKFQQRIFLTTFIMTMFLIRCSFWDIHFFLITGSDDVISWIIDKILTLFWEFLYLLNRLSYEVVQHLILLWTHKLRGVIIWKYFILRTESGLKLLLLAKMAILG